MNDKTDISFDFDDKNLFLVDDLKLKADAIRYSILPKIEMIINICIAEVLRIYDINILENSSITKSPNFRKKRQNELKKVYSWALAGIRGKRDSRLWQGVLRADNKVMTIVPFTNEFILTTDGLFFEFHFQCKQLIIKDYTKFYDFIFQYVTEIESLIRHSFSYFNQIYFFDDSIIKPLQSIKEYIQNLKEQNYFDIYIYTKTIKYPISRDEIDDLIFSFLVLYPIYDAFIQISKGQEIRFQEQINLTEKFLIEYYRKEDEHLVRKNELVLDTIKINEAAEQKVKIMPAIRWQVFQRDNWKCVSCGRNADDGIILHIDHIIPRSKGGKDTFENYQTLCNICNIGKSNKDDTNIKKQRRTII